MIFVELRALVLIGVIMLLAGCGSSTLDEHTLKKDAESIASFASEGTLLSAQVGQNDGTTTFTRVHSAYLVKDVQKLRASLEAAQPAPGVAGRRAQALHIAARVEASLAELHASPGDRQLGVRLASALTKDADAADALAK
jgi:hypothetical protein